MNRDSEQCAYYFECLFIFRIHHNLSLLQGASMGRRKIYPYIGRIPCRGNPRGCPIVGRFSRIDRAVSRYESRPTQAQETHNYPGSLEHKERRSPFPTNDSVLCPGKGFVGNNDRCSLQLLQNVNTP